MAANSNIVETLLRLKGSREFQAQATASARSLLGIGKATEQSGKKAKLGWKGVAAWGGATAALGGAAAYARSAVHSTEDLAKSTMQLQRSTGMDARTSSAWVEILKTRNIGTKQFGVATTKLSKLMEAARSGNAKAIETFRVLGVSQDAIASGNVQDVLLQTADAMQRIQNPAQRAALAQQALGKQGAALMPLMQSGSQGIQEQIDLVTKYGATLGSTDEAKQMIARQREMTYAMDGLKITLGTKLLPTIEAFTKALLGLVQVAQPVLRSTTAMQIVIGLLATAFLTLKVAMIASTISTLGFNAALLLIPLAVVAIVAGLIVLYNKWRWFHNAVDNTVSWVRKNWPLLIASLGGPFGLAVLGIVKNIDKIRGAFGSAIHWIANRWRELVAFVTRAVGSITSAASSVGSLPGKALGALKGGGIPFVPGAAAGGTITAPGMTMVGERGPEILALPRAAQVIPLDRGAFGGGTIVTQVYLERRQIAEAVGSYTADRKARR